MHTCNEFMILFLKISQKQENLNRMCKGLQSENNAYPKKKQYVNVTFF